MKTRFEIAEQNENSMFNQICIKNIITGEYISILPKLGARLNAAHLRFEEQLIQVIRELKDENLKSNDDIFNNAKLFPFANRIRKGKYTFQNSVHEFPINYPEEENACHGFLYDAGFNLISKNIQNDFAEVELEHKSTNKIEGYPFCFRMTVIYKFTAHGEIIITTSVFNLNNKEILFSDGWHPYYYLNNSIDNFVIEFNADEKLELNEFNIPNGVINKLNNNSHHRIELKNINLDDLFRYSSSNAVNLIDIIPEKSSYKISIWQESGNNKYNYLVLYTPPDRKSIAIEPMTSSIDAFNNKDGLIILKPGETWSASMGFSLQKK